MTYFLDLFSGIGGFALGAEWAGMKFAGHYYSEVDDYAIRVYQRRFPEAHALGDIREIKGANLPSGEWIIAGGFPCQDISVAGKGLGLDGARSGLWFEYARLIGELRPRYAIMENVGALVSRGLDRVLGSLAALGYDAEWQDIRASDVGAPHRRERIWIIAYPQRDRVRIEPGRSSGQDGAGASELGDDGAEGVMADAEGERVRWARRIMQDTGDRRENTIAGSETLAYPQGKRRGETRGLRRDESTQRASGSSEALADTDDDGLEKRERKRGNEIQELPSIERSSQALADPTNSGNVRRNGELEPTQGEMLGHRRGPEDGRREWWTAEPDVGGTLDGLSAWLDGFDRIDTHKYNMTYGTTDKERPGEILRAMQDEIRASESQWKARGSECISSQEILLAYLCKLETRLDKQTDLFVESTEASQGSLRSMRDEEEPSSASYRPESEKQLAGKYRDTLQALPRLLARDAEKAWLAYRRENAPSLLSRWLPGWEDGIPRVSSNVPSRVDRLKCLGNAIVPQIAEMIFRGIAE